MTMTSQASFAVHTPPMKPTHAQRRSREYRTSHENDQIIAVAQKVGRYANPDAALILFMYRQGLREAEVVSLRRQSRLGRCWNTATVWPHECFELTQRNHKL